MGGTGAHTCIWSLLLANVQKEWIALIVSSFVQYCFGGFYYQSLLAAPYFKAVRIDKGVPTLDRIKQRHSMTICHLVYLTTCVVRTLAVIAVLALTKTDRSQPNGCMCPYGDAALFASALTLVSVASSLWSQRPWGLIFVDSLAELLSYCIAASMVFAVDKYVTL